MSNRVALFHFHFISAVALSAWKKIIVIIITVVLTMCMNSPSIISLNHHFKLLSVFCAADLIIHTSSSSSSLSGEEPLKQLFICMNCPHPQQEGSLVYALIAKYSTRDYDITGQVVYCIPNGAESSKIVNRSEFADRIVLVDRGRQTTIQEKISRITKGIGDDDGQCHADFSFCGSRMGSVQDGGFSAFDDPAFWATKVSVPVFLVSLASAERMKKMMNLKEMKIPRLGVHNVTVFEDDTQDRDL